MIRTGLMGGSFNPAHGGHRRVGLAAIRALELDELWWLVSPGNPLKADATDMAPFAARLRSAERMARGTRITATGIERSLNTRYTLDTVRALGRLCPTRRFIWIMGADNLAGFHQWRGWRALAATVPIAVAARPGYMRQARSAPAMGWLGRFVRPRSQARCWTTWSPPALVLLRFRLDPRSASAIRAARPDWAASLSGPRHDRIARRPLS